MEKRNINMRCRFSSSYFDVQIVISWSLWSGFLRATLFGNSEFFIFVLASFLLIVSFYPYLLYQLLQLFRFLFVEGHCKNYRVTGNDVFTILVLSCCENKLSEIPRSTRNHLETLTSMSHLVLLNTPRYQRTLTTTVLYRLLIKKHIIREGKLNADPYNLAMSATSVPTNRTLQRPLKSRQQKKITKYFLTVSVYSDCTLDNVNTKPCCISFLSQCLRRQEQLTTKLIEHDRKNHWIRATLFVSCSYWCPCHFKSGLTQNNVDFIFGV